MSPAKGRCVIFVISGKFCCLSSSTTSQVAQKSCECSSIRGVKGQVGEGFVQPGLMKDVPGYGGGVGLANL